jgi:hypothetical protein
MRSFSKARDHSMYWYRTLGTSHFVSIILAQKTQNRDRAIIDA